MTDPQQREIADLAVAEEALPAIPDRAIGQALPAIPDDYAREGMEDIDRDDLIIPRIRVIQPTTTKFEGPPGTFHQNLTGKTKESLRVVLFKVTKTRVYWDREDRSAPAICASDDNSTPRPQYANKCSPTNSCKNCAHSVWGPDRQPPDCRLVYAFLAADMDDDDMPFIIGLSGTSAKNAKRVISTFFLKNKPLWSEPVTVTSLEVKNDEGRWFEIVMVPSGGEDFNWQKYRGLYQVLKAATITADTERTISTDGTGEEEKMAF